MTCRSMGRLLTASLAVLLLGAGTAVADRVVTCGESWTGSAELAGDCSGDLLIREGSLNLRGFTVSGSVRCAGDACEIYSEPPKGTLYGSGDGASTGIDAGEGTVTLRSIVITGFGTGVKAGRVTGTDLVVIGNAGHGIRATDWISVRDCYISLNGHDGLHARLGRIDVRRCEFLGNRGRGIRALKGVELVNSEVAGSGAGGVVNYAGLVLLDHATITGNSGDGVRTDDSDCFPTGVLEIRESTITGNAQGPECGDERACADVVSCQLARVGAASHCETSHRIQSGLPGENWRICSEDR